MWVDWDTARRIATMLFDGSSRYSPTTGRGGFLGRKAAGMIVNATRATASTNTSV
jgi:hypothetical protein